MPYYPEKKPKPSGEEQKQPQTGGEAETASPPVCGCLFLLSDSVWICPADPVLRRSERFPEHGPGIAADSQAGRAGNRICSQDTGTDRASIHITN